MSRWIRKGNDDEERKPPYLVPESLGKRLTGYDITSKHQEEVVAIDARVERDVRACFALMEAEGDAALASDLFTAMSKVCGSDALQAVRVWRVLEAASTQSPIDHVWIIHSDLAIELGRTYSTSILGSQAIYPESLKTS